MQPPSTPKGPPKSKRLRTFRPSGDPHHPPASRREGEVPFSEEEETFVDDNFVDHELPLLIFEEEE